MVVARVVLIPAASRATAMLSSGLAWMGLPFQ
jgi:hypothetical protein